ncbi:MAG: Uma2 family endonuclease [SAR324 cluster bacterium]|nr:Uma2 family endonuclease [SAR324 cluster bacterium]
MNWQEVCADPNLQDLPYKIELNEWGQIVMSPVRIYHSFFQGKIEHLLQTLLDHGEVFPECAIKTSRGTKVADVVWVSQERFEKIKDEFDAPIAPEICIEVISPNNTRKEMLEKKKLYFEVGAEEFWLCDENGEMSFYHHKGKIKQSRLVPDFPKVIPQ